MNKLEQQLDQIEKLLAKADKAQAKALAKRLENISNYYSINAETRIIAIQLRQLAIKLAA